jgi:hypothetical protein
MCIVSASNIFVNGLPAPNFGQGRGRPRQMFATGTTYTIPKNSLLIDTLSRLSVFVRFGDERVVFISRPFT